MTIQEEAAATTQEVHPLSTQTCSLLEAAADKPAPELGEVGFLARSCRAPLDWSQADYEVRVRKAEGERASSERVDRVLGRPKSSYPLAGSVSLPHG